LKVTREDEVQRQTVLNIEMEEPDLESYLQRAYQRVSQKVKVPGFRPGKAPRAVVERVIGRESLLQEALEFMVPEATAKAIEQEAIEAGAQPDVELIGTDPVSIKATVPLIPLVETGDYSSIRVLWVAPAVSDEQINDAIEEIRKQSAIWDPVERPAQIGDQVVMDLLGVVDGETLLDQQDGPFVLSEEPMPIPGFGQALVGLSTGDTREFALTFPEDYLSEAMAGKECLFTVTAKETKEQKLPDLDDEFAKGAGEGFDTLDALKDNIRQQLQDELEHQDQHQYEDLVLDELAIIGSVELPSIIVERAIDHHLEEIQETIGRRLGRAITLEEYIEVTKKTEEELREETRETVEQQLRRSYLISEVSQTEGIEASEEDIEAEIDTMATTSGEQGEQVRQMFMVQENRDSVARSIRSRHTVEHLVAIAKNATPAVAKPKASAKPTPEPAEASEETSQEPSA
jgi:trigger factor